jgi:hypothetical protein
MMLHVDMDRTLKESMNLAILDLPFSPSMRLPFHVGVVLVKLLAQTECSQAVTSKTVLAYRLISGLPLSLDFKVAHYQR